MQVFKYCVLNTYLSSFFYSVGYKHAYLPHIWSPNHQSRKIFTCLLYKQVGQYFYQDTYSFKLNPSDYFIVNFINNPEGYIFLPYSKIIFYFCFMYIVYTSVIKNLIGRNFNLNRNLLLLVFIAKSRGRHVRMAQTSLFNPSGKRKQEKRIKSIRKNWKPARQIKLSTGRLLVNCLIDHDFRSLQKSAAVLFRCKFSVFDISILVLLVNISSSNLFSFKTLEMRFKNN